MKSRTTKKIVSCILSVLLLASAFILPVSANEISDAVTDENTKSYLVGSEQTFDGTQGNRLDITDDLDFFKDNSSATWTMSFKTTDGTNLQVLTGLFSGTNTNNYLIFYVYGGKIGAEIRNDTTGAKVAFSAAASYADGNYHTVTFTVKENEYYKIYFDGECILTQSSSSTTFCSNLEVDFATASVGGASRYSNQGWQFTGSMKDVYLSNFALDETEILKFHGIYPVEIVDEISNVDTTGTEPKVVTDDFDLDALKAMDKGTINITYKRDSVLSGVSLQSYLAFSNGDEQDKYASFYLNSAGDTVGFEFKSASPNAHIFWNGLSLNDGNWHNLGFVYDGTNVTLYVDGVSQGAKAFAGMLSDLTWIDELNTVSLGGMVRTGKTGASNQWFGDYNINNVTIYSNVMSESQMASIQSGTGTDAVSDDQASARTALFYSGYADSGNYRIPAMVTAADGTLVASIDQRKTTAGDYGDIDLMVRRSEDKGETWSDPIMLTDLPAGGSAHSFIIDSELLVAADGTIYCLVDMFPESFALMNGSYLEKGSGYKEVDGKKYMILYDAEKNEYTLRDNGVVYTPEGEVSNYKVTDFGKGTLVKTVDGVEQSAGSIFLYSGANKGELSVLKTSYLWLFKSTDDGLTWSEPVDITGMVKADWMVFCGTGPGRGTTTTIDGKERLIFSIYHTNGKTDENGNSQANLNTQASAVIYSDDGGLTWTRGEAAIEANGEDPETSTSITQLTENQVIDLGEGKLAMFSRGNAGHAYMSLSTDGGATWDSCAPNEAVFDTYCQMSALKHEYNGKEYLVISNPNAGGRNNMTIRVTDITDGTISTNSADWSYTTINAGHDQYSCLTSIDENTIGILYETDTTWHALDMVFQKFDFAYLLQGNGGDVSKIPEYPEITGITAEVIDGDGEDGKTGIDDTVRIKATLGSNVFTAGEAALTLKYNTLTGEKTAYANYFSGSGSKEIYFDYVIDEAFEGDLYVVLEPIANLQTSTGRSVSSLRNGETFAVASYGISASDDAYDVNIVSAEAGSSHSGQEPSKAIDGSTSTMWHSEWGAGNNREDLWIELDLGDEQIVSGLRYLPRQSEQNGIITKYEVLTSIDGEEYVSVASGEWALDSTWKKADFGGPIYARYIKLVAVDSYSSEAANTFASAAEIDVYSVDNAGKSYYDAIGKYLTRVEAYLEKAEEEDQIWFTPDITQLTLLKDDGNSYHNNSLDDFEKYYQYETEAWLDMNTKYMKMRTQELRLMSGDVDENGVIQISDATLIQYYLAQYDMDGITFNLDKADTTSPSGNFSDGDGQVTVDDVTGIQKYLVKKIPWIAAV